MHVCVCMCVCMLGCGYVCEGVCEGVYVREVCVYVRVCVRVWMYTSECLVDIQRHLSVPEAATTTRIGRVAAGSWSFPKLPITRRELPQRSNMERGPKIHAIFRSLILSDVAFGKL